MAMRKQLKDICRGFTKNIALKDLGQHEGQFPIYGASGYIKDVDFYCCDTPYIGIVKDGSGVGRVDVYPGYSSLLGTMQYIVPKDEVDLQYLKYALIAMDLGSLYKGAAIPHIYFKEYGKFFVDLPDLETQKHISASLDTIQKAIDLKRKQLQDLDELVKSKFQEMFGDVMLPESKWEQTTFGKAFDICSGGTPSTSKKEYWEDGTIPWIGSNMCQDWIIYHNDGKFITQEGLSHSSAKLLEPGTVLVALVGATIGKTALLRFRTTTNQNVAAIKVNDNTDYYPEFVFYLLQGLYGKFMNYSNGKFAMATLSFVRDLPLIKPQKSLQGEFVDYVEKVNSLKGLCEREIVELNELMDSKMDEYFG